MKDGIDYAEMLEMPVSSCDVVFKPAKRKRKSLKDAVIAKVNGSFGKKEKKTGKTETLALEKTDAMDESALSASETAPEKTTEKKAKHAKKFKFDVLYAEGVIAFLLVAAILLTNIFWEDSGINRIFKSAFGTTVKTDERTYLSFNAKSPSDELAVSVDGGVMTFSGKGSIYPVCDGKVESVTKSEDKYVVTVSHSDLFKTVISGMDYVYAEAGEEVYKYIPIGYVGGDSAEVKMYNDGVLLTGYVLESGSIVWEN